MRQSFDAINHACRMGRKRAGETQLDVAIQTGYDSRSVSSFETCKNHSLPLILYYMERYLSDSEILTLIRGERNETCRYL